MLSLHILKQLDLDHEPFAPKWKGANAHIGPVDYAPPLLVSLSGKTTFGTITMMAGILTIAGRRIQKFNKTAFVHELVEASFAWHYDWRYVNHQAKPNYQAPDQPPEFSALLKSDSFLRKSMKNDIQWHSYFQPIMNLFHLANVTKFIMSRKAKPIFSEWLMALNERMEKIASAPDLGERDYKEFASIEDYREYCSPRRGTPLPPAVLELDQDIDSLDLAEEARKHLKGLDHTKNRFLRSPEEMQELGFEGTPYQ